MAIVKVTSLEFSPNIITILNDIKVYHSRISYQVLRLPDTRLQGVLNLRCCAFLPTPGISFKVINYWNVGGFNIYIYRKRDRKINRYTGRTLYKSRIEISCNNTCTHWILVWIKHRITTVASWKSNFTIIILDFFLS